MSFRVVDGTQNILERFVWCGEPMSLLIFFFSSRRRHTRCLRDWSSDVCSSDLRFYGRQPRTVVAVTGTNGKTSVVHFVREIWATLGLAAASLGTLGLVTAVKRRPGAQIGRASCRERGEVRAVAAAAAQPADSHR